MSYRKITVDGKRYEYVIGRSHLKIKLFGIFPTSQIGNPIQGTNQYLVTPINVARAIQGILEPLEYHCKHHHISTTEVCVNPFEYEIHDRTVYMMNCPECYRNAADDI